MLEFDKKRFAQLLLEVPEKELLLVEAAPSPYVQSLMDTFDNEGRFDLTTVDLDAFELKHVTPVGYESLYEHTTDGWVKGFINFCRKTPPLRLQHRSFF